MGDRTSDPKGTDVISAGGDSRVESLIEIRYTMRRQREDARRIRALVLELTEAGVPHRQVAELIGVSLRTIGNWLTIAKNERAAEAVPESDRAPYQHAG